MTKPKQKDVKLGGPCAPGELRDAIHIATVPVIAGEQLWPGQDLKFAPGSQEIVVASKTRKFAIGIADPFWDTDQHGAIENGKRFWMCMFPYTITSLRHEWTHPAFNDSTLPSVENKKIENERVRLVTAALIGDEKWLREFATEVEISYEELIQAAHNYLDTEDYHVLPFDTPGFDPARVRKFWENFQSVTGRKVPDGKEEEMFFSCSC